MGVGAMAKRTTTEGRLRDEIAGLKQRTAELDELQVVKLSPTGILIHVDGCVRFANAAWAAIVGKENPEDAYGLPAMSFVHPEDHRLASRISSKIRRTGSGRQEWLEYRLVRANGSVVSVAGSAVRFTYQGEDAVMLFVDDISQRKQAEEALKTRERELENKTQKLVETNIALKVLLRHREEDRRALESTILANVKELVFPFIEKLRGGHLSESQRAFVDIIESGLNEIMSPFLQKMTGAHARFTPTEVQVTNLVKNGKTTKEIAELLNIGTSTVDSHRNSIRNKLGLRNSKTNLQTYLLTL
jgi:PAS domain S-box-containing protein